MCFSRTLLESLILFSLANFENVTSHRIALGKITRQNALLYTVLDRKIDLKERLKARFYV